MKKICCIGSVTTDIIISPVDHLPASGTSQMVQSNTMHVGGCASNTALDLGRLGIPVLLSCKVGKDTFGDFVIAEAKKVNVDVSGVIQDAGVQTTTSVVCVNSQGERSFLYYPGSTSDLHEEDISDQVLDACDIVFIGGAMLTTGLDGAPCKRLFDRARAKGKLTVMDAAWDFENRWMPKMREGLTDLDLFMPSYDEAMMLTGEKTLDKMADALFDCGVKQVIIKTGEDGAYFAPSRDVRFTLPAYPGIKPVDTTGAGDAFCAGFLCGLAHGWDFKRCGQFANAVGAFSIQAFGASAGVPSMQEVLRFMEQTPLERLSTSRASLDRRPG